MSGVRRSGLTGLTAMTSPARKYLEYNPQVASILGVEDYIGKIIYNGAKSGSQSWGCAILRRLKVNRFELI